MVKASPIKIKTPLRIKIFLIIFGILLSFIFLETGLRFGGFVLSFLQEYKNRQTMKDRDTYRIMCLGESTTAGQYPQYLQEILNRQNRGVKFKVIDKGRIGISTTEILNMLESNINHYQPDMVITMIGVNDRGEHIPYEKNSMSKAIQLLLSLRTYKLIHLLEKHMQIKIQRMGLFKPKENDIFQGEIQFDNKKFELKENFDEDEILEKAIRRNPLKEDADIMLGKIYQNRRRLIHAEDIFKEAIKLNPKNASAYYELGNVYEKQSELSQAETAFRKALELNPKDTELLIALTRVYSTRGKFSQAEDLLREAITRDPDNFRLYVESARNYQNQDNYAQAEYFFIQAMKLNPYSSGIYLELERICRRQHKFAEAEKWIKEALKMNPQNKFAYHQLGYLYQLQNKIPEAEDAYKQALRLNSRYVGVYLGLGKVYQKQGKFSQAIDLFKQALRVDPRSALAFQELSFLYEEIGQLELAKEYKQKHIILKSAIHDSLTVNNYYKIKDILNEKKIKLVVVQYPLRSLKRLRKIFKDNGEGIVFVDNESIFKDAVRHEGYSAYFRDKFAGDFGHCTKKGNRLLAKNIANVIIKEIFHDKNSDRNQAQKP